MPRLKEAYEKANHTCIGGEYPVSDDKQRQTANSVGDNRPLCLLVLLCLRASTIPVATHLNGVTYELSRRKRTTFLLLPMDRRRTAVTVC